MGLVMSNRVMLCLILVVKILMLLVRCSVSITQPDGSSLHNVEWSPGFNFTQWSIHQRFYVGDSIHFVFKDDNSTSRVMEVSKTSYASCSRMDDDGESMNGGGSIVVYKLMEPRRYFFIDTAQGHCSNLGMRLALSVSNNITRIIINSKLPSTSRNNSSSSAEFLDMQEILVEPTSDPTKKKNDTSKLGGWLALLFMVCVTCTFICIQKHKQ